MTSGLRIEGLRKAIGGAQILHGIDLDVARGEFVVFVGPSGCGKSTLLRTIAGLETPDEGRILIEGRDVTALEPAARGIAMVFQSYALYPHMTVRQNMGFGLRMAKADRETISRRVDAAAEMLQIGSLLDRLPKQLSGGQRQRVAIGRAIARDPSLFLFDEPLSNLDAALRAATRVEIARLNERLPDTTMVYVTHDQVEAMTLADRIVVLQAGRIEQVGAPMDLHERPANRFVAQFIGSPAMNVMPVADGPPGAAHLGVRPEHLTLASDGPFEGRITLVERLGDYGLAYVQTADGNLLTVRLSAGSPAARGDHVRLAVSGRSHWFDADGRTL